VLADILTMIVIFPMLLILFVRPKGRGVPLHVMSATAALGVNLDPSIVNWDPGLPEAGFKVMTEIPSVLECK